MKRIYILIVCLVAILPAAFSQFDNSHPNSNSITLEHFRGGVIGDSATLIANKDTANAVGNYYDGTSGKASTFQFWNGILYYRYNGAWAPVSGTASNGLTKTGNNTVLGGTLTQNTTINTGSPYTGSAYTLYISGSYNDEENNGMVNIHNLSYGGALVVHSDSGYGIAASSDLGIAISGSGYSIGVYGASATYGVKGVSTNGGTGIYGQITSSTGSPIGYAGHFLIQPNSVGTNAIAIPIVLIQRNSSQTVDTTAPGIGGGIYFVTQYKGVNLWDTTTRLISRYTNVNPTTRTSQVVITGLNNAVTDTLLKLNGNGSAVLSQYGSGTFTGTPAYTLAVDASGNIIEISGGGGGSGNNIYNIDSSLAGNRIVDLDGNTLSFQQGGNSFLLIDPTENAEQAAIQAYNITGGTNVSGIGMGVTDTQASMEVSVAFNANETKAGFDLFADATTATLTYTADTQTFNIPADGSFNVVTAIGDYLNVRPDVFQSNIGSTDGTASSSIELLSDLGGGDVYFRVFANDGTHEVSINGDAVAETITLTAANGYTFQGGPVQMTNYGAGSATFDASGNISSVSDIRLKNIQGYYRSGLAALDNIDPIIYKWNELSGMEMEHQYIGFSAQNIQSALGDNAIGINKQGYLSIQDRAIMATIVNAVKEQQIEIKELKKEIRSLKSAML